MSEPFSLVVPVDAPFRAVASEVAGRYVELAGGSPADGAALAGALTSALEKMAAAARGDGGFELAFGVERGGVRITVQGAGQSTTITQPVSTRPA